MAKKPLLTKNRPDKKATKAATRARLKAEEDKKKEEAAEDDEEEEDETPAAEGDEEEDPAAEEGGDDEGAAEGDDEDDEEEKAPSTAKKVKARIKAIQTSAEARGREDLASHLAFNTNMSVKGAIAALKVSPKADARAGDGNPFREAMGRIGNPKVASGSKAGGGGENKLHADMRNRFPGSK